MDAGRHDRNNVVPHLQSVGVEQIDILIGTHSPCGSYRSI
ncbi:hypothetical protein [Caldalkalibacillus uzonensis]